MSSEICDETVLSTNSKPKTANNEIRNFANTNYNLWMDAKSNNSMPRTTKRGD